MHPSSKLSREHSKIRMQYLQIIFARAAKKKQVKRIIYLSGIIPDDKKLSDHLESRFEVRKYWVLTVYL